MRSQGTTSCVPGSFLEEREAALCQHVCRPQLHGEEPSVYHFPSPHRAFGWAQILFSGWHGVEEMGNLGKSLEWMVQKALLLENNLHAQRDIILGIVGGTAGGSGGHLWDERG